MIDETRYSINYLLNRWQSLDSPFFTDEFTIPVRGLMTPNCQFIYIWIIYHLNWTNLSSLINRSTPPSSQTTSTPTTSNKKKSNKKLPNSNKKKKFFNLRRSTNVKSWVRLNVWMNFRTWMKWFLEFCQPKSVPDGI